MPASSIATLEKQDESPAAHFVRLVQEWKQQSRYLSNSVQMAMLKPYQRIIGMGVPVVPLLLEELHRQPDHWFWALESITGTNPVQEQHLGQVALMAQDWVNWGREQGLLAV